MQVYPDRGVKAAAIGDFMTLVSRDKKLEQILIKHRSSIRNYLVYKIQQLGVHDYAKRILDKKSSCRIELESMIAESCLGEN